MDAEDSLDDLYIKWLYGHYAVVNNHNPARSYWMLTEMLYTRPFIWRVANDDNRAADGVELRDEFIAECGVEDVEIMWLQQDCSMLEMLVALARRADFESEGTPAAWFGKFLENLGINYTDKQFNLRKEEAARRIEHAVIRINHRQFETNGEGGIFPLKYPTRDQREVELWYQMSSYLLEGGYIDHGP